MGIGVDVEEYPPAVAMGKFLGVLARIGTGS